MKEFDPTKEKHWPVLIIKIVDAGCAAELQIESTFTGEVKRLTTTEDDTYDEKAFNAAILETFWEAWNGYANEIYS